MEIELRVPAPVRRGHQRLALRLEEVPATVTVVPVVSRPDPTPYRLMSLEHALNGGVADAHLPTAPPAAAPSAHPTASGPPTVTSTEGPDRIVIDLTDEPRGSWAPWFDDRPGEGALLSALQDGRLPLVTVRDETGATITSGRPGSEQPGLVVAAYADVLAGLATLLVAALTGTAVSPPAPDEPPAPGVPLRRPRPLPLVAARKAAGGVARHAYRALYRTPHWRVGWRLLGPGDSDVWDLLGHPAAGWRELPDDGHHFYADPFPFEHEGRTWLFVEDFDHRVGRGVISVVGFDDDGPVGVPHVVLEHDVHLSYPHVMAHDGEVWMVPETSAAGRIELYRARAFPDRWTREAVLVDGVEASDATLFQHADRWWMLATVRRGGSFSDTLHAWTADDLLGPWRPHAAEPLVVDIASARPAGHVVVRDGRLLRPVQDNRNGYGAALLLTEVTRLDDEGFDQRVLAGLGASPEWPGRRLHTLNRAGRLEVIDGSAMSPRLRRPRRPTPP
ncbi:hypothetical protein GCM10023339_09340 [Alloalcanivorax gelatiniphagus]